MPKLKGSAIPRPVGRNAERLAVADDELVVVCKLDDCDWQTVRPLHAAWSAADAHRIRHLKGMV